MGWKLEKLSDTGATWAAGSSCTCEQNTELRKAKKFTVLYLMDKMGHISDVHAQLDVIAKEPDAERIIHVCAA